jgi:aldehyde dehydrogenase (NAD+)
MECACPFFITKMASSLAAGHTMVIKTSEKEPLSPLIASLLPAAGFPPGVVNVVNGYGLP